MPITSPRATVPKMRARTPALPGGTGADAPSDDAELGLGAPRANPANPRSGDALVLERGARRATGNHAYHQPPRNGSQDAGGDARAPRGDRR
jgi:hypothetical protein